MFLLLHTWDIFKYSSTMYDLFYYDTVYFVIWYNYHLGWFNRFGYGSMKTSYKKLRVQKGIIKTILSKRMIKYSSSRLF